MDESLPGLVAERLSPRPRALLLAIASQAPLRAHRSPTGELTFPAETTWPGLAEPPTAQQLALLGPLVDLASWPDAVEIELSKEGRAVALLLASARRPDMENCVPPSVEGGGTQLRRSASDFRSRAADLS